MWSCPGALRAVKISSIAMLGSMSLAGYTPSRMMMRYADLDTQTEMTDSVFPPAAGNGNILIEQEDLVGKCGADGGTRFPGTVFLVDFGAACEKHDAHYNDCNWTQRDADDQFLVDMHTEIGNVFPRWRWVLPGSLPVRLWLEAQALAYWTGVDGWGENAFRKAQARCSDPETGRTVGTLFSGLRGILKTAFQPLVFGREREIDGRLGAYERPMLWRAS